MRTRNYSAVLAICCLLVRAVLPAAGQDVTWDGNGAPDADGVWSTALNWDGDVVPTSANRTILPSVSTGTRTVTQDTVSGTTANALRFVQDNPNGVGKLSLNGNLTLSQASIRAGAMDSTASAFQVSLSGGATQDQVIVDLNGNRLYFSTTGSGSGSGGNLAGIVNFNVANSRVHAAPGHSRFNVFGTLNVSANGEIGRVASSQGYGALDFLSGSVLNIINNATLASVAVGGAIQASRDFTLTSLGTLNIGAGSTLAHRMDGNGQLRVRNSAGGKVVQAGTLEVRGGNSLTSYVSVNNSDQWSVSGESARILRNSLGTSSQMPSFANDSTGLLQGAGSNDTLEYDRSGTVAADPRLTITNSGAIAPGDGSQGSALTSAGNLTLRDIDLTMGATGEVELDLGGSETGQYDQLLLQTGATDPAGAGALDLSAGGTLQLYTVNGFVPGNSFSVPLITAGSITGTFATVKLDGDVFTENELALPDGTKYVLAYSGDTITLTYAGLDSGTLLLVR